MYDAYGANGFADVDLCIDNKLVHWTKLVNHHADTSHVMIGLVDEMQLV